MSSQFAKSAIGLALVAAYVWLAFGFGAEREPTGTAWRDMNEEIEAWLEQRAAGQAAAEPAPKAADGSPAASVAAETGAASGASADVSSEPPRAGEARAAQTEALSSAGGIDLNRATAEQLDALPGIGPAKAQAVIEYREAHGPFSRPEDVLDVQGIGPAIFSKIQELIVVREAESGK